MEAMLAKISKFQRRMKNMFDEFDGRRPRVLLIGLDGAGKTSILYKAKLDDTIYANVPPRGINIEHMTPKRGANIQVYDMTGNKMARLMWNRWFRSAEAIIYVVDSADKVRLDEAKFELHEILKSRDLRRIPVIVVANKQDLDDAQSTDEVSRELDLASIINRDWSIFGTSAQKGTNISKVFKDVVEKIIAYRHYKNGLQTTSVKKRDSKKSLRPENSDTVSHSSSIEEPLKVKSLFDSISEKYDIEEDTEKENTKINNEEETSHGSEQGSEASAKYDKMDTEGGIPAPDEHPERREELSDGQDEHTEKIEEQNTKMEHHTWEIGAYKEEITEHTTDGADEERDEHSEDRYGSTFSEDTNEHDSGDTASEALENRTYTSGEGAVVDIDDDYDEKTAAYTHEALV